MTDRRSHDEPALPLLSRTPESWALLAARNLPIFLADHAVCEQQAALSALNLIARYPDDVELVERMSSLAVEEAVHLRRVTALLHRRGLHAARRRSNPFVQALRARASSASEPRLKIDRLLVGALIEARSSERFTRLLEVLGAGDPEVVALLGDLGPAERRHWETFFELAARGVDPSWLEGHWREWLTFERELMAERGVEPTVHG